MFTGLRLLEDKMPRYLAYGLSLRCSSPLPGLLPLPAEISEIPEIQVVLGSMPQELMLRSQIETSKQPCFVSSFRDESGVPNLRVWELKGGDFFSFKFCDGTEFAVGREGTPIWAVWPHDLTLENALGYLLGPVLGSVLRFRGVACLHASAVAIGGQAVAFVGEPGAGKSTTAAALVRMGCPLLSDDIVALADRGDSFLVQPALPRVCLWPESVATLFGSRDALPPILPGSTTWDKRYLDATEGPYQFQQEPLQLNRIYVLGEIKPGQAIVSLEHLPARQGLIALLSNTYANNLLNRLIRAREFEVLSRVARNVPVVRLTRGSDPAYFANLFDRITEDIGAPCH